MMKMFQGLGCLLLTLSMCNLAFGQRENSALLPVEQAKRLARQCSRPSPSKFTDTWQPTKKEMETMESGFSNITGLRAECCIEGAQIKHPEAYYMQYAGLILDGRKIIYISAIPDDTPPEYWKEFAIIICDGGSGWGVVYDEKTGKFSDLAINGV